MNAKFLMYLSLILITFDGFPFNRFGLGSTKALSIIPLIVFIIINLPNLFKMKLGKREVIETILIIGLLGFSGFIGKYEYDDISEFKASISMFLVYIITIISFKLFFGKINKETLLKAVKCIYMSFSISLFFGILEFIYFYISKNQIIYKFLTFFLRDEMYLSGGRLQFNFSEPGTAALMLVGLFIPNIYIMARLGYKFTKLDKLKIILIFLLSVLTKATTYYALLLLLVIFYLLFNGKPGVKKFLIIVFSIFIIFSGYLYINSDGFIDYSRNSSSRFIRILGDQQYLKQDNSTQVRTGLWELAIYGWKDKPISGYGWGYFKYAIRNNYHKLNEEVAMNYEMQEKLYIDNQQTYSIYSTVLVEGGGLGVIWLIVVLAPCFKYTKSRLRAFLYILLVLFVQLIFIYNVVAILLLQIYSNKGIIELIDGNEEFYEKNDMLS